MYDDPRCTYMLTDRWKVEGISKGIPKQCSVGYYDYRYIGEVTAPNQASALSEAKSKYGRHYKDFVVTRIELRREK